MQENLKKALLEAAEWEKQLKEHEKTEISYSEARKIVLDRIFEKYNKEPLCIHEPISLDSKYTICKKCTAILQMRK